MSEHNARQLLRALAEIDDLREKLSTASTEVRSAFIAGWSAYNGSRYATGALAYEAWKRNPVSDAQQEQGDMIGMPSFMRRI